MSINCTGSKCSQEDHLALRSQGHERIRVQTGIGKNHVKGEGTKRGNGRNGVNAPMTDIRIVIIGRIGTTEIVTGTRKEKDTGVGIATELVIVIETKVGIVVVTMSVIVIALERGRVKETMMLKTMTMIVGGLVIGNLIMIGLNRNMRGTDMVRGRRTMITLNQRMIVGGMNSLSMGISIQTKTKKTLSLMSVVEVGASMIIWMSRTTMTIMNNIMTVVMTNMIEWRMMITNMSMQHRSHVKGREQEMWSMSIKDWSDHSHILPRRRWKNHVKGEGTKRGNGRNSVNAPMTDIGIVIIGRIGTTEIVKGTRKEKDTGVGIVTELVIVIETKVGIVVVTMSVIVIAHERGRVKETMMLKTMTMIVGGLVIGNLIMIGLNRNMRGTDMVRGRRTMITLNQRMIVGGMNSLSMGISIQTKTKKTLSLMSVVEVGASMIIWMSRTTMTVMNNTMTVVMTNMIEWRMMITNMSMQHWSHMKGREQEMWSMSIKDWSDHSHILPRRIWKNHVKGEGTKRGNGRNSINAPMTDIGIVIIGRIGTTEIVKGTRKEKDTGVGIATELVIVIETKVGIVVMTMSVIVIAHERGRVKETMMLKTMTMIVGGLVIGNLIMIGLNRNMRGTDMVRGRRTMITLNQRMIVGGMNSLSMGISIQTKTKKTLSLMSVVEVGASMIIWMSRTTMTVMNIP
uniref:Uncharacterized protein n=1 Tax=Fagus sylvatica TaxID=28930 RepID=A0A2N9GLA6_FAGSY